ncbi:MAG: rhodanese-like domain-containing protein [Nocardioides sp.]
MDVAAGGLTPALRAWTRPRATFLYDADGGSGAEVATRMHDAGFRHVYTIEGGYAAWVQSGGPSPGDRPRATYGEVAPARGQP